VGTTPFAVAVTPDGKHAYVTNVASNNVSVINTATNTVGSTIPVAAGTAPLGVAVTPDGKHAYVANNVPNTVSVIDTATNTVVGTPIPVGSSPVGVGIIPPSASALQVSPSTDIAASGIQGQLFSPASFAYQLSSTTPRESVWPPYAVPSGRMRHLLLIPASASSSRSA
jgi:YVTN family beta-propeller protein